MPAAPLLRPTDPLASGAPPLASGAGGANPSLGSLAIPGQPVPGSPLAGTPPPTLLSSTGNTFTATPPTPTAYGSFTAPNPAAVASDPYYRFRAKEGQQAIQRSAAARGTLLNGGTLKALEGYRQGLASEEAGKAFDRALASYNANRETAAQNYGQQHTSYGDTLAGFTTADTSALDWARLNAAKEAAAPATGGGYMGSLVATSAPTPGYGSGDPAVDSYAAAVQSARAQNAAERARIAGPMARTGGYRSGWVRR